MQLRRVGLEFDLAVAGETHHRLTTTRLVAGPYSALEDEAVDGRTDDHVGLAGLWIAQARSLGVGGGKRELCAWNPALLDLLPGQGSSVVEAVDPDGLGFGLLGRDFGLGDERRLLVDLRTQQGVVELDEWLASLHVTTDVGEHAGDAEAGEVGAHGRLFTRNQHAGRGDAARQDAGLDAGDGHPPRRLGGAGAGRRLLGVFGSLLVAAAAQQGESQQAGREDASVGFVLHVDEPHGQSPRGCVVQPPPSALEGVPRRRRASAPGR